ncbi:MAG: mechanosensitive ion channel family protein [Acidobacteriota bacterium]|nr:mechanosensitive ion channel family protein [Blastocatellia bacterium]MDW8412197.1 mechanosensitive ion channel family protein [Acidobacteriota bacterium]
MLWHAIGIVVLSAAIIKVAPHTKSRVKAALITYLLSLFFAAATSLTRNLFEPLQQTLDFLRIMTLAMSILNLLSIVTFELILTRINIRIPRILSDTMVIIIFLAGCFWLLKQRGVDISGLITTSAVLTVILGLSLQDTLGNIIAGLSIQVENEIRVGDVVKVGDYTGRVKEIRWRRTSIETKNWETVLVPNSLLVKGSVVIYGRREGEPLQTRRWIYFNVDIEHSPTEVIECVDEALQFTNIEAVADKPKIHTILMDFKEGYARYCVCYWLTNLAVDDLTDSLIRTRIYFALKRAGMSLVEPSYRLSIKRGEPIQKQKEHDLAMKIEALRKVPLFKTMTEQELSQLAEQLKYSPFAPGEVLTKQGTEGHWLYIITEGEVSVSITVGDVEKEINRLQPGQFFGEMSLMTGQPRSATVTAVSEVICYRLDKGAFQQIVKQRPEIAEDLAEVLALRKLQYDAVFESADQESKSARISETRMGILNDIRGFFGL